VRPGNRLADRSVIRPVLEEIAELSLSFILFNVVHARHEANQAAHSCAKFANLQE
jgi:hypothetical protein